MCTQFVFRCTVCFAKPICIIICAISYTCECNRIVGLTNVARAMRIVLASMRFANSWGKTSAQAIACWSVPSRKLQTVQYFDRKCIRNCVLFVDKHACQ